MQLKPFGPTPEKYLTDPSDDTDAPLIAMVTVGRPVQQVGLTALWRQDRRQSELNQRECLSLTPSSLTTPFDPPKVFGWIGVGCRG